MNAATKLIYDAMRADDLNNNDQTWIRPFKDSIREKSGYADWVEMGTCEAWEDCSPLKDEDGVYADLLRLALSQVDWPTIFERYWDLAQREIETESRVYVTSPEYSV